MAKYSKDEDDRVASLTKKVKALLNSAILQRDSDGVGDIEYNEARGVVSSCKEILDGIEELWELQFSVIEKWGDESLLTGIKTKWEASRNRVGDETRFLGKRVFGCGLLPKNEQKSSLGLLYK